MAEFVFKKMASDAGLDNEFEVASAATSTEEIGNQVYPPAKRKLSEHGISCTGKTARQMTRRDYEYYDLIIVMDRNNLRNIKYIIGSDDQNKVSMLMSWVGEERDVADPWYTGDFDATYRDVVAGCKAIISKLNSTCRK